LKENPENKKQAKEAKSKSRMKNEYDTRKTNKLQEPTYQFI
jgi:hypothetical protein